MVGAAGLEPATPSLSSWCSSQLSYAPTSDAFEERRSQGHTHTYSQARDQQQAPQIAAFSARESVVRA